MLSLKTLYDLDVLSPVHNNEHTLWQHINHCRTEGGKEVLRDILLLKNHSVAHTISRQDAIAYIANKKQAQHFPVTENEIYYVQHYLSSNYTFDETKYKITLAVKSYIRLFTSKSSYLYILSGIKHTLQLIDHIKQTCDSIHGSNMPESLEKLLREMYEQLGELYVAKTYFIRNEEASPAKVFSTDKLLRLKKVKLIYKLLDNYYKLEALMSLAKAHIVLELAFPTFGEHLKINALRHPLVEECTPNQINLSDEHICLITGPNMAGKSTFLKSTGLAFLMGYVGVGVSAESATLPFYEHIETAINTQDNIAKGYSYFYSEVKQIKSIAETLNEHPATLVIADELFKGTNIKDASDCTKMVINGFMNKPDSLFLLSTHLAETVHKFENTANCLTLCFEGINSNDGIRFDYKVKNGVSHTRLGLYIMQQEDVPALLGLTDVPMIKKS